jgi:hypothetical protein
MEQCEAELLLTDQGQSVLKLGFKIPVCDATEYFSIWPLPDGVYNMNNRPDWDPFYFFYGPRNSNVPVFEGEEGRGAFLFSLSP